MRKTLCVLATGMLCFFAATPCHALMKNVAGQTLSIHLWTAAGADVETGTTTCYTITDAGTESAGAAATHGGHGTWHYAISQAETNGAHVSLTCTNSGGVTGMVQTYTINSIDDVLSQQHGPGVWAK